MNRTVFTWIVLGALGLALAVGITAAASSISSQHVGLSSEPLSAGEDLAPRPSSSKPQRRSPARTRAQPLPDAQAPVTTLPAPQTDDRTSEPEHETGDDSSGRGRGRGSDD